MTEIPTIDFEEKKLDNGLVLLLHQNRSVPLVHVSLHYRVGSSHEEPGLSGFAHLFEHLMFQGSENLARNEHGRHIDQAGGSWNASTNKDRTNYFETLPSPYLELALWLEADRMRSLQVTSESFENQRHTVIEEKKQSYDNRPYGKAYLRFDELAYRNWAYAHPIIGSVEDLERCTLDDALKFHQRHYGPGNATLVLAGDFEGEEAWEKIQAHFAGIPDGTSSHVPDLSEPPREAPRKEVLYDPLASLPVLTLGYHMPEIGSPYYYALTILSMVMSEGDSSRFYRRFVHDHNWVTALSAGPNQYKGPGIFMVWAQLQAGVEPDTVVGAIEQELAQSRQEAIGEEELERVRRQLTFNLVSQLRTVSTIGERLARYAVYFDDPGLINRQLDRFLAVTPEEVAAAARDVFRPENQTLILVLPGRSS